MAHDIATLKPLVDAPSLDLADGGLGSASSLLADGYERGERVRLLSSSAGRPMVFLVGPEANHFVLTGGREHFSHHAGWGPVFGEPPNMVTLDGEEHAGHRRAAAPAFSLKRMDVYLALIDEVVQEQIAAWGDEDDVDVYEETRSLTFDLAARAFLGVHPGPELRVLRAAFLLEIAQQPPGARQAGDRLLLEKIAERRAGRHDDALALLARHELPDGGHPSDASLLAHARFMLEAGYETSATLAAWTLHLLTVHRDYEDRVVAELAANPLGAPPTLADVRRLEDLDRLLLEAERMYPPVPFGPRGTVDDVEFDGYRIPAGTSVMYSIAASHLLPSVWQEPARFDPDRFAPPREEHRREQYALVGFGGGPRRCLGMGFARAELAILVARVVTAYRLEQVPGYTATQSFGITARPLGGLRLRALPRLAVG